MTSSEGHGSSEISLAVLPNYLDCECKVGLTGMFTKGAETCSADKDRNDALFGETGETVTKGLNATKGHR